MAEKALKMVEKWKTLVGQVENETALQRAVGWLECCLCAVLLDKKSREFQKMEDACISLLKEFAEEIGKPSIEPPESWKEGASEEKPKATAREGHASFRVYDEQGHLKNQVDVLASMGFRVGVTIQNSNVIGEIKEIHDSEVTLLRSEPEGGQVKVKIQSLLQKEWKEYEEPKQQTQLFWVTDAPHTSAEFGITVLKGKILATMHQQVKELKGWLTVQLWKDPKALKVSRVWQPKKLALPCATSKILVVEPEKATGITIGVYGPYEVCIVPYTKFGSFCNPMWMVPGTDDEESVNMEVRFLFTFVCNIHTYIYNVYFLLCMAMMPSIFWSNTFIYVVSDLDESFPCMW